MSNPIKLTRIPWQILILTWLAISLVAYGAVNRVSFVTFSTHNDYLALMQGERDIRILDLFANLIWAFTGVSLFAISCLFAGTKILDWGKFTSGNRNPLILPTGFVIGELFFSCIFMMLTVLKLLSPFITLPLLFIVLLIGWRAVKKNYWSNIPQQEDIWKDKFKTWVVFWLACIFFSGLLFTSARLSYDSVTEYFSNAKYIVVSQQTNLLFPLRGFAVSALHSSLLFSALSQLFGDQAARMLSWVNGGVILLAGWQIGRAAGLSARAQLYFLIFVLTSTAFVDLLGDGKIELISTAPLIAALGWMIDSLQNPSRGRFLLIGALLGFAIIARPYNIFLVPVFTVLFYLFQVWPVLRCQGWNAALRFARPVLWMFPTLLFMGLFHLWQNDLWLGSPFAPLTYARELDSGDWQWQFDPGSLNLLRLLYPFTVTFLNTPQSLGNISPLFVGLLPFLLLPEVRARLSLSAPFRSLLFPALLTLLLWISLFFTVVEIRYIFFLWFLLFLFSGQVLEATFDTLESCYQAVLRAALILLLAFMPLRTLLVSLATYSPIDSNGQAHCYGIPFCTFLNPLNETAPEGARVFALHAYRYYLRPDLFACSSRAEEYAPLQALAREKSGEFWAELYRQGFQYIAYEKNFARFHSHFGRIPAEESAPEWLQVIILSHTGSEIVYELQPINPPFLPLKTCAQTNNGIWQVKER